MRCRWGYCSMPTALTLVQTLFLNSIVRSAWDVRCWLRRSRGLSIVGHTCACSRLCWYTYSSGGVVSAGFCVFVFMRVFYLVSAILLGRSLVPAGMSVIVRYYTYQLECRCYRIPSALLDFGVPRSVWVSNSSGRSFGGSILFCF